MNSALKNLIDRFVQNPGYLGRGAGFLAKTFKTTVENIYLAKEEARKILHGQETSNLHNIIAEQEEIITKQDEQIKKTVNAKGECSVDAIVARRVKTLQDLIEVCEIDAEQWEIVSWECNKWEVGRKANKTVWEVKDGVGSGKTEDSGLIHVEPLFQVKAKLKPLSQATVFGKEFQKFLADYTPNVPIYKARDVAHHKHNALLVLPKQDAHFNRYDIKGRNDIYARFQLIEEMTMEIVAEAAAIHNLNKVTYIVGSDQFNSEWTGLTTAGTPQENILQYQEAFKLICDHEIRVIENLLVNADHVEILFVPGNHDEYAGWHLINWLSCYYRGNQYVTVTEGNPSDPRRYERYGTTAVMYDHGATLNGKELAQRFPLEFKKEWSLCENYYIFSGDKHHEMSLDVQGIKYYRVPALTPTKSKWEHKKGYLTPGEMQAFLIKENVGLTNMYSRLLE